MSPSSWACREVAAPGTLVMSVTEAPADLSRIVAIFPSRICSVKSFEPTDTEAPSRSIPASGPSRVSDGVYPPALPRPQDARTSDPVATIASTVLLSVGFLVIMPLPSV